MEELIKILKALSDPNRVRILKMLEKKDLCVCEISAILKLANSTVSKHLSILRQAGLIYGDKEGKWVYYKLVKAPTSLYLTNLMPLIKEWLNEDAVIRYDLKNVRSVDKIIICA